MIETTGKITLIIEQADREPLIDVEQGCTYTGNKQLVHVKTPLSELGIALDETTVKPALIVHLRNILDILEV
jgi:hypothetical protein